MKEFLDVAKNIGLFLGELIVALYFCRQYVQQTLKKPDITKLVPEQNKIDLDIITRMDYVKELLNADRIHLYEFHNGEHYADYRSACKFSCSYEVVKAGNKAVRNTCVNIPISVMPRFVNRITTTGLFSCTDISKIQTEMPSTYAFKRELGVKEFYDMAIRNKAGEIIGFLAIQWDRDTTSNVDEDEIKRLVWYVEDKLQEAINLNK